jgi:prepilin-type N-terminal cleavage/methylation domain-containing protein
MRLFSTFRSEHGFTLIELMITLLILSILVTIVVLTMKISRDRAEEATCKANLRTVFQAIIQYQSLHDGNYPPDLDTLADENYIKDSFDWRCPAGATSVKVV